MDLPATQNALFTWFSANAVTSNIQERLKDDLKTASTNTADELTSPPTHPKLPTTVS